MKYGRVMLISPRYYTGKYQLAIHPVVGLGYVAESLKTAGFSVNVFDMNLQYNFSDLQCRVGVFKPDIIGFTLMTFGHRDAYDMIHKIKSSCPGIKIVVGGPHVSTMREKVLQDCTAIDYGIVLEGDESIVELCNGKELDKIQGLIYRVDGKVIMNKFENFIEDLDAIPFPKYELFELHKYPAKQIGISSSRGCPYDCIYCPVISAIGKKFRTRSAQNVVDEIEYWYGRGYRVILILDDNFTLRRVRVEEICALMQQKNFTGLRLRCPNGIRADKVDRKLLKTMRDTGFDMISFGVEAGSDKVLRNIKKGETLESIERSIKDACDLGFDVDLFFLIGSPGETMEDVKQSFDLALRYPVSIARFYNVIPFPTTELFNWVVDKGYLLCPVEDMLNNASHLVNEPTFFTPEMSAEERKRAFKMGQNVTMRIRRKYLERKFRGSRFIKKIFALVYTLPFVDRIFTNNRFFIMAKERFRGVVQR